MENANFNNIIDEIRSRMDIVDIISEHVALKKKGRNWAGLCPFHNEKTPSFQVSREKNIFKCFGCGAGGDGFVFLQRINNKTFKEVLVDLAEKYGIKLEYSADHTDEKKQILEANHLAAKYFSQSLFDSKGKHALEYLQNRDITEDAIFEFFLGYAPDGWDNLINYLHKENKISLDILDKAGLIIKREKADGHYDRFRNRLIVPIHNERGQIIGFGGRVLDDTQPKYLNSPETLVYNKSRTLYGLYQAKDAIREEDGVIITEGYFDVISLHVHGVKNVVATCGTALTNNQLKLIGRYTESKRLYMSFDADVAGQTAAERGIETIKETFGGLGDLRVLDVGKSAYEVKVISVPDGKDPDEFIRNKGVDKFRMLVSNAPSIIDFQLEQILKPELIETTTDKLKAISKVSQVLGQISSPVALTEYIRSISDILSVREEDLRKELKRHNPAFKPFKKGKEEDTQSEIIKKKKPIDYVHVAEKNLISLFFIDKSFWQYASQAFEGFEFSKQTHNEIVTHLKELVNTVNTIDELNQSLLNALAENQEAQEIISEIVFSLEDKLCLQQNGKIDQFIKDNLTCIARFKSRDLEKELREKYINIEDDDIEALETQYKVKEIVNSRLSSAV